MVEPRERMKESGQKTGGRALLHVGERSGGPNQRKDKI
jgi:hypothetical protein